MAEEPNKGLGNTPASEWPKISGRALEKPAIQRLAEDNDLHQKVLSYLTERINLSERAMKKFYARWQIAERKVQAYIQLTDYEQLLKNTNKDSKEPYAVPLVVPYGYASQATIATYLLHTFAGRKPIFQIGANKAESVEASGKMEIVLQWNSDAVRMVKQIWQHLNDSLLYGLAVYRIGWKKETQLRTVYKPNMLGSAAEFFGIQNMGKQKTRERRVVFEGNDVQTWDPFMFFPDPRFPMAEVSRKGEFVFWKDYVGKHKLKLEEAQGQFKYVNMIPDTQIANTQGGGGDTDSARSVLSEGDAVPGYRNEDLFHGARPIERFQGTCWLIPSELGLGTSSTPELWIFTIGNRQRIIQAEPFSADHGMHPVAVSEPFSLGYGFGQPGLHDYVGPLQDTMTWFMNSHIRNVRTALNNMFVVDPSMIEMQDLKNPNPGKIIRLKQASYGQDVRTALNQLQVADITRTHVADMQVFMRMGDALMGLNENLRGQQDAGGRKTATEVRTTGEAAASRLAALSRVISAQSMVDLTEQMCLNTQQYMTEPFYQQVVGTKGMAEFQPIGPEMVVGDFHFPVHDGTLPLDKVAMLDAWKEIWIAINSSPQLQQTYDGVGVFDYLAELGGARNLDKFKRLPTNVTPQPTDQVMEGQDKGTLIPFPGGNIPGVEQRGRMPNVAG